MWRLLRMIFSRCSASLGRRRRTASPSHIGAHLSTSLAKRDKSLTLLRLWTNRFISYVTWLTLASAPCQDSTLMLPLYAQYFKSCLYKVLTPFPSNYWRHFSRQLFSIKYQQKEKKTARKFRGLCGENGSPYRTAPGPMSLVPFSFLMIIHDIKW